MQVSVRKEHIEHAACGAAQKCMIAVAIRQADPTITYVAVRTNGITISRKRKSGSSTREHWAVPLKAARAIVRWDAGEEVRPFSFEPKLISRENIPARTSEKSAKDAAARVAHRARLKKVGKTDTPHRFAHRVAGL